MLASYMTNKYEEWLIAVWKRPFNTAINQLHGAAMGAAFCLEMETAEDLWTLTDILTGLKYAEER